MFILQHSNSYVQRSGEFLSSSLRQLPLSPLTVALIYNVKAEVSSHSSPTASQVHTPSSDSPPHLTEDGRSLTYSISGSGDRANDIYIEWDTMETMNAVRDAIQERYSVLMINSGAILRSYDRGE
ncbi:MAG: hypothetical protein HW412_2585 [Bacteroidetes bacterium]|nr:hypothetical protein [Bacteroidota bacterium]